MNNQKKAFPVSSSNMHPKENKPFLARSSNLQPFPAIPSHLQSLPAFSSSVHQFPAISSHFKPFPAISSLFQPFPAFFSYFLPFPAISGNFQFMKRPTPRSKRLLSKQKKCCFFPFLLTDDTKLDLKGGGPGWGQ